MNKIRSIYDNTQQKLFQTPLEIEYYQHLYPDIQNKKIIAISPGGYKGFYTMGIVAYIKDHYDLYNFIFTGASAGSWNSLFACLRPPDKHPLPSYPSKLHFISTERLEEILEEPIQTTSNNAEELDKRTPIQLIHHLVNDDIKNAKNVQEMEQILKRKLLATYTKNDFDLDKLYIGVTQIPHPLKCKTVIYSRFENLEDAIDCCIASSHVPLVTGKLNNIYRNHYCYDGGFLRNPYLYLEKNPDLHITPGMWKNRPKNIFTILNEISEMTTLFSKNKYDFMTLFKEGYQDAKDHKEFLDSVFLSPSNPSLTEMLDTNDIYTSE
jgi:hypothetical protein